MSVGIMLLLLVWSYQLMMASTKGDLTIATPASYFSTIEEIADSNRSVYVRPGMLLDSLFSKGQNAVDRKINRKIIRSFDDPCVLSMTISWELEKLQQIASNRKLTNREEERLNHLASMIPAIRRSIGFLESATSAGNVAAWVCYLSKYNEKTDCRVLKTQLYSQSAGRMIGFSKNISMTLKKRITVIVSRLFQSGISNPPISSTNVMDPQGMISKGKIIPCFDQIFSSTSDSGSQSHDLPLSAYSIFFKVIGICFACCFLAWVAEIVRSK